MGGLVLLAASVAFIVKTGMSPAPDALVSLPIPELKGAVRVVDARGTAVPCAVRADTAGVRYVAFRLENADILELLDFTVEECSGPQQDLPDIPQTLPGMNLMPNPDFSRKDASGDVLDWSPSPRGYGIKEKWTDEWRKRVRYGKDFVAIRGICLVTYIQGLRPGRVYRLSYEGRAKGKTLGATMWYQGDRGKLPNDYIAGIGNYKTSHGVSPTDKWTRVEDSSYVYFDKASGQMRLNCRGLLPGTGSAYFYFYSEGGTAAFRNLRFEDVTDDSGVKAVKK